MTVLTAEQILASRSNPRLEKVPTPEWAENGETDPHVYIRGLTGAQVDEVQELAAKHKAGAGGEATTMAAWCVLSICDEAGGLLFDSSSIEDLLAGPLTPLRRVAEAALALNGFSDDLEGN